MPLAAQNLRAVRAIWLFIRNAITVARPANDLGAILTPGKMAGPTVAPWVKELYLTPGLWVNSSQFPGLELIAEWATQAEILRFARTSQCLRNDMIHVKGCQRHFLKRLAILASVFRSVPDKRA
jgi:hypothetical protein